MIKFNDKNVFVGFIKELLHTFNLPNIKCYTEDAFLYDGATFIKDNYIQQYRDFDDDDNNIHKHGFYKIMPFNYDRYIRNYTKTLKLNSNIYDSHTHQYLGEYLRFIRDYKNLDLMSMYNCFNDNIISSLYINWENPEAHVFETESNYKIYSIPVKFGKKYTIALSTSAPVELVCGIYSKGLIIADECKNLYRMTYQQVPISDFKKPFIYDKLDSDAVQNKFLYEHESDLKLFIKLPINNSTSIVVLEGEYLHTNEKFVLQVNDKQDVWRHTRTIFNYKINQPTKPKLDPVTGEQLYLYGPRTQTLYPLHDEFSEIATDNPDINKIKVSSSLQLLELNTTFSYPFADRLIEYLVDNCVTNNENIGDNIERVQEALMNRKKKSEYEKDGITLYNKSGIADYKHAGLWEDRYKGVLYNVACEEGLIDTKFDILGYLDKDVELKLSNSEVDIYNKK